MTVQVRIREWYGRVLSLTSPAITHILKIASSLDKVDRAFMHICRVVIERNIFAVTINFSYWWLLLHCYVWFRAFQFSIEPYWCSLIIGLIKEVIPQRSSNSIGNTPRRCWVFGGSKCESNRKYDQQPLHLLSRNY